MTTVSPSVARQETAPPDPMLILRHQGVAKYAAEVLDAYSLANGYPRDFALQLGEFAEHGHHRPGPKGGLRRIEDRMRADGSLVLEALDWATKQSEVEGGMSEEIMRLAVSVKTSLFDMSTPAEVAEIAPSPVPHRKNPLAAIGSRLLAAF